MSDMRVNPSLDGIFRKAASLRIGETRGGAPHKSYSPLQRLLQRAVVPPRTVRKLSEILRVAIIFLNFFKMSFALPGIETTKAFKS